MDQARCQQAERVVPHFQADEPEGLTEEQERLQLRFRFREIKSQSLGLKEPVGFEAVGGNPSLTGELVGKTHRVLEHAHHPPDLGISTRRTQFPSG